MGDRKNTYWTGNFRGKQMEDDYADDDEEDGERDEEPQDAGDDDYDDFRAAPRTRSDDRDIGDDDEDEYYKDDDAPNPSSSSSQNTKTTKHGKNKHREVKLDSREVILTWGKGRFESAANHFKCCNYTFLQNGVKKLMRMYFTHAQSTEHTNTIESSFMIRYRDVGHVTSLNHIFQKASKKVTEIIKEEVKARTDKYGPGNTGTVSHNTILICELTIKNAASNIPQYPLSVDIEGISGEYTTPCSSSWDRDNTKLANIISGTQQTCIYQNRFGNNPDLYAIHGIHDINKDGDISDWGELNQNFVLVKMATGRFLFLMINLPHLMKEYVESTIIAQPDLAKRLPEGITPVIWKALLKFMKNNPPPNMYDRRADMETGYISTLMNVLNHNNVEAKSGTKQLLWLVADDSYSYRVPLKFLQFCLPKIVETTKMINMVKPENLKMKTTPGRLPDSTYVFGPEDIMTFNVSAVAFVPLLIWAITEVDSASSSKNK